MDRLPPFAALVLPPLLRQSLLCCAVDPGLRGLLIAGPPGSGKSVVLGSFTRFLAALDPDAPVVTVPLHVDRERLLGGIDLEATLRRGRAVRAPGLLARAARGWILLDNLSFAEPCQLALVKQGLDTHPGLRVLAATTDGAQPPWPHLVDALPFLASLRGGGEAQGRADALHRWERWAADGPDEKQWSTATDALAETVRRGRARLPRCVPASRDLEWLAAAAGERRADSPRTLLFAAKAARAHAALSGHASIEDADLAFAVTAVLDPRAVASRGDVAPRDGSPRELTTGDGAMEVVEGRVADPAEHPAEPPPEAASPPTAVPPPPTVPPDGIPPGQRARWDDAEVHGAGAVSTPDRVFPPQSETLPLDLQSLLTAGAGAGGPKARPGSRGRRAGFDRGRHVRSRGRVRGRRLALAETLRRAVVRQGGRAEGGLAIRVARDDLRYRQLRSRCGTLFLIAVDASGSMAWHRMQEAKGLALGLLRDAYVHRDAVALIAFRGTTAFRLLPPTTALARAHRELRSLPTGGGTPLAAALRELQALAQEETVRRPRPALAILLTDGRANVPLDPAVSGRAAATAELQVLGALYRRSGPKTVLIDTTAPGVMRPDARRLADLLGATYRRLEASLGR